MDQTTNPPIAQSDPASAFADLRGEVSLLRRAVEGLTAERQNAPDYTPTLTGLSSRLARTEELLGKIAESPAMRLTPENLAVSIARASETARAGDRETLDKSGATLRASIATINGVVEHAWAADGQWKQLYWTGGGGLLIGALGALSILHLIG
ncbi:hypothetical protein SAMN05518801_13523 [Novosphingobium sp. CF614]|uniref:DUF6118 family protein n=1 Tax=Novosphingobium sp. CF614 TaxID=1884364 RepID=UPI0008ED4D4A|nr:DUF6118 family protein [Novosphingobium sp. CF614]SFG49811.1 hypothetical protein SAMN05518801_13523 [Novosphingobium sp. CF614]